VGTPDYLSPEILLGVGHGFGVDWWALGVMTFEFLVGIPPFADESAERIFQNILNREMFEWPTEIPVSEPAKAFVDKLLELDSNKRMGAKGSQEVKSHPFFLDITWENVLTQPMTDIFVPKAVREPAFTNSEYHKFDSFSSGAFLNSSHNAESDLVIPNFTFKNLNFLQDKNSEIVHDYDSDDE